MATNNELARMRQNPPNPSEPYATATRDSILQSQLDEANALAQTATAQRSEIERLPQRIFAQALVPEA